ncbi:hypothetical protein BsWGS_21298 [Bradybaena similaris]
MAKCLSQHSSDKTADCPEESDNHPKANGVREFSKRNGSGDSNSDAEAGKANTQANIGVEAEVKAIVKVIEERSLLHALEKTNVTISSAIYRDIPPVYDDLIKVTMNTKQSCRDASGYHAIIAVHSAPKNFQNRATFRWLYGDFAKTNPYRFKLIFFIGLVTNATLQDRLKNESLQYDDIVQGNYIDAYINMTYKAIMVFDYLDNYCKGLHAFFRVDDDVFMNIGQVFTRWSYVQRSRRGVKTIMCYRLGRDRVLRTGKWAVPRSLIPDDIFRFMRCPGFFAAFTVDLIHSINELAKKMPFFWIDDIVMLGLVPNAIEGLFFYPGNKWIALPKDTSEFENCIQTRGSKCYLWIGITKIENFEKLYGYLSGSIPLVK